MIAPILIASPSFTPVWLSFLEEWKDDGEELPIYSLLSDLARHIADLLRKGSTLEIEAIFQVVERWHTEGDAYVRTAAIIGLLEDLQNTNVVGEGDPEKLAEYLQPESKRFWHKVERFWSHGEIIRDD